MQRAVILMLSGSAVVAAGCSAGPALGVSDLDSQGHYLAMDLNGNGDAIGVRERSATSQNTRVSIFTRDGRPETADVAVGGVMDAGGTVPASSGLSVDQLTASRALPNARSGDTFLGQVYQGNNHYVGVYQKRVGPREYVGFMHGGDQTRNMPVAGTATYNGQVRGLAYGSQTGASDMEGTVSLGANFGGIVPTIGGRMANITLNDGGGKIPLGADVIVNAAPIVGSRYQGTMSLVNAGTNNPVGVVTDSSHAGAFYGSGAPEAAGSFSLGAVAVPIFGGMGATEQLEVVGGYSTQR
jgi:hypothetical protein